MVQLLSCYPRPVLDRACDPVYGIPALLDRWNLSIAAVKKHLDNWGAEYADKVAQRERERTPRIEQAPENPEIKERVAKGLKELSEHLKAGFGPSTASDFKSGAR